MPSDNDIFSGSQPTASPEDLMLAQKVSDPGSLDELDIPANDGHVKSKTSDDLKQKKTNPLIFVAIGVGVFFLIIVIVLIARSGSKGNSDHLSLQSHQTQNQLTIEVSSIREQFSILRNDLDKLRIEINSFKKDVDGRFSNTDISKFNDRLNQIENSIASNASAIKKVATEAANKRPLEDYLVIDKSARILSIGNGIARVRDEYGEEFSLQKGDRWDGKTVTSIRADLRKVFLSNGSVIE